MRQQHGNTLMRRSVNETDRQGTTEHGMEMKCAEEFNETPVPVERTTRTGEEEKRCASGASVRGSTSETPSCA